MIITQRHLHPSLTWPEYAKLPGHSFSGLKAEKMPPPAAPTEKMKLGTRVHNYLLTPSRYDWQMPELVLPVAKKLAGVPGLLPLLRLAKCEVPATATFSHCGFTLPWKGIADMHVPGALVLDLKVTEMPLAKAIAYFRYDNQQSGYCGGYNCPAALIVGIHPVTHKVSMEYIAPQFEWWEEKCLTHGEPVQEGVL